MPKSILVSIFLVVARCFLLTIILTKCLTHEKDKVLSIRIVYNYLRCVKEVVYILLYQIPVLYFVLNYHYRQILIKINYVINRFVFVKAVWAVKILFTPSSIFTAVDRFYCILMSVDEG